MTPHLRPAHLLLRAIVLMPGAGFAFAQPAPATNDPLSGPKVVEPGRESSPGGPTLVERDFSGKLTRLDVRPEEAALGRLPLSEEEKAATQAILSDRASQIDAIVRRNVDLLLKGVTAQQSGDRDAMREVYRKMRSLFGPLGERGGLQEELASELSPEHEDQFRAMVKDYWAALLREERENAADRPGKSMDEPAKAPKDEMRENEEDEEQEAEAPKPRRLGQRLAAGRGERADQARLMTHAIGIEIRASYERIVGEGQARLDEAITTLGLSADQESKVRALALEYAQQSAMNPTAAQKRRFFLSILELLTPEQRRKFIEQQRS